jgi:hypothetical protein
MELNYDANMFCNCGNEIEPARVEIGKENCFSCASLNDSNRPKGRMVFGHKTAGEIQIFSAESFRETKKYYTPNGARSCVKNFSKNTCA